MSTTKKTICLGMIVRNESKIIERCLKSTLPLIDTFIIADTGSTDNTIEVITNFFKEHNIPGEVVSHEWKNFAHNRTHVMKLAKDKADYTLIVDADDSFQYDDDFKLPNLELDSYDVKIKYSNLIYYRPHLVSNRLDWRWESVVHEYLTSDNIKTKNRLTKMNIHIGKGGDRSKNPDKFKSDIKVLHQGLIDEPCNPRYVFYLAQSYRDDGDNNNAIKYYKERSTMGGFPEEVYISLYQIGRLMHLRGDKFEDCSGHLLKAYNYRPNRLEALHVLVNKCRLDEMYNIGYHIGKMGIDNKFPNDQLFVEKDAHTYQLLDEVALCAHYSGHHNEALKLGERIISENEFPKHDHDRLNVNVKFYKQALGK
jgi:glycosyltransferase involved in cell wall biosynthesis